MNNARNHSNESPFSAEGTAEGVSNVRSKNNRRQVAALLQPPKDIERRQLHKKEMQDLWSTFYAQFPGFDASRDCIADSGIIYNTFYQYSYWIRAYCDALDHRFGLRRDGSTRWSHAIGTLRILFKDFTSLSLRQIFVSLGHDVLEDFVTFPGQADSGVSFRIGVERELRKLLSPLGPGFCESIICDIQALTKPEIQDPTNKQEKQKIEDQYLSSLSSMSHDQFVVKCADRYHSLTHFSQNPLSKVQAKLEESEKYFIPEFRSRILEARNQNDTSSRELYEKIQLLFTEQIFLCRATILYSERHNTSWYSMEHECCMQKMQGSFMQYFREHGYVPLSDLLESDSISSSSDEV